MFCHLKDNSTIYLQRKCILHFFSVFMKRSWSLKINMIKVLSPKKWICLTVSSWAWLIFSSKDNVLNHSNNNNNLYTECSLTFLVQYLYPFPFHKVFCLNAPLSVLISMNLVSFSGENISVISQGLLFKCSTFSFDFSESSFIFGRKYLRHLCESGTWVVMVFSFNL